MAIHIKPSHRGRLHEKLGVAKSKTIPMSSLLRAKHGKSPEKREEATFAVNARSWHHGG